MFFRVITIISVSYTHLDVYKRQGDISFEKGTMHIGRTLQRIRTFCSNSEEAGCYSTGTKITITSPKSGNSDREIPLPGYLLTLLQKWRGRQEDYLMPGRKKEYTEPRTLQYRFLRILKSLEMCIRDRAGDGFGCCFSSNLKNGVFLNISFFRNSASAAKLLAFARQTSR